MKVEDDRDKIVKRLKAENENLKKRVADLEDELEEAEEAIRRSNH